ncbi:MAG: 7-cyano-7-deazaguanine synthase, partial [Candidatus Limisoma sp.]|nr:7-cyano-7-deazaguanine synthase [Candidatus Limisoma sp.]
VACGIAESRDLRRVMLANHFGDHAIYPDCRRDFVDAMSEAMRCGTYCGVTVFAPYTDITKADIARRGALLGIDYAETYSCYKGGEHHCGRCGTCRERREAMALAGIDDPTVYDE